MTTLLLSSGIALGVNYGIHTATSHAYNHFCVAQSIWDIPYSIVATASPMCSFFVSTIQMTQTNFATILTTTLTASLVSAMRT